MSAFKVASNKVRSASAYQSKNSHLVRETMMIGLLGHDSLWGLNCIFCSSTLNQQNFQLAEGGSAELGLLKRLGNSKLGKDLVFRLVFIDTEMWA